jgi:hypothetical protein
MPKRFPWVPRRKRFFVSDFTPGSLSAVPYAIFFVEENDAQLALLHVVEPKG